MPVVRVQKAQLGTLVGATTQDKKPMLRKPKLAAPRPAKPVVLSDSSDDEMVVRPSEIHTIDSSSDHSNADVLTLIRWLGSQQSEAGNPHRPGKGSTRPRRSYPIGCDIECWPR